MAEPFEWDETFDGVESLVRAAGHYVRASDDLRPRVLEEARVHWGERMAQRCLRHVAMFVLLLAFFTAANPCGFNDQRLESNAILVAAGFHEILSPKTAPATRSGDGDWRMIDAFTELRRQQAQVLRLAL